MKSLHKRLDKIQRKLLELNSPPPRWILRVSAPEGFKYFDGNDPVSADQLHPNDTVIFLEEEPLPDFLIARWQQEALEEDAMREAEKRKRTVSEDSPNSNISGDQG